MLCPRSHEIAHCIRRPGLGHGHERANAPCGASNFDIDGGFGLLEPTPVLAPHLGSEARRRLFAVLDCDAAPRLPRPASATALGSLGVLAGSGMGGLTVFQDGVKALVEKGPKKITPFFIPYAITNMGGALLAIEKGFMGPNYSISTACATANYAFNSAANHIRKGDADIIVAGGVEAPIIPVGLGGFVACRALSSNNENFASASKPWDKNRDGFVMGEGAGLLVMESLESALKRGARIHAEYLGGAITCDAYGMTDPLPDGSGVGLCIEKAVAEAGIDIKEINYINAHATSTMVGDVAEVNAVKKAFKGDLTGVKMNGTKSMVGHCLGAAAGVEAVATIMAINFQA